MQAHLEVAYASATDEPFAETVDEIVAQLREDPILVTQMMGNGARDEIDAILHAKLEQAQVPVYVVLTRTPLGVSGSAVDEEITSLVHAGLDSAGEGDGIYVVRTSQGSGHLAVYGDLDPTIDNDETMLSLARYTAQEQVRDVIHDTHGPDADAALAVEPGIVLDIAASPRLPEHDSSVEAKVLTPEQLAAYADETWMSVGYSYEEGGDPEPASPGLGAVVAVTGGVVGTGVTYRLLRALGAPRRRAPGVSRRQQSILDREQLLADARAEVDRLDRSLSGHRATQVPAERLALAIGSRDAALELLDSDDLLDLVGARVLSLTGRRALASDGGTTYRPCYVDPTHGEARHRTDLAGGLHVPVCRPCHRDLEAGRQPSALVEVRRGRDRPYYAGDTVWARTGFGSLSDDLWRDVRRARSR